MKNPTIVLEVGIPFDPAQGKLRLHQSKQVGSARFLRQIGLVGRPMALTCAEPVPELAEGAEVMTSNYLNSYTTGFWKK